MSLCSHNFALTYRQPVNARMADSMANKFTTMFLQSHFQSGILRVLLVTIVV